MDTTSDLRKAAGVTALLMGASALAGIAVTFISDLSVEQGVLAGRTCAGLLLLVAATCSTAAWFGRPRLYSATLWASNVIVSLTVYAIGSASKSVSDIALFYVLPILVCSYFHSRRSLIGHLALATVGYFGALVGAGQQVNVAGVHVIAVSLILSVVGLIVRRSHQRGHSAVVLIADQKDRDPLTGLLNRAGAQRRLTQQRRAAVPHSVLFLDIDRFNAISAAAGHRATDEMLVTIADCLRSCTRQSDLLMRFTDKEFVGVFPEMSIEHLSMLTDRIADRIRHECETNGLVTASYGVTEWRAGESFDDALGRANLAMNEGRSVGPNRTCTGHVDGRYSISSAHAA